MLAVQLLLILMPALGRTDFSAAVWKASVPKPEAIPA